MMNAEKIRAMYPKGTRIRLECMEDPQAVPPGTMGAVQGVDDIGQIQMAWDNGRSLSLIPGVDDFCVIHEQKKMQDISL